MTREEIKEYLNRVDKLLDKLKGEDKETLSWLIYGYNQCAKLLNEAQKENKKLKAEYGTKVQIERDLLKEENEKLKAELQLYQGALKREHEAIHKVNDLEKVIDEAIEYINKYAWQEDIIGGIYTTTGKPVIDRYMQLEWDNCNELLDILKEVK